MKVNILQENLLKSLTKTGRIISTKPQLPILQNVLLTTEEGRLRIVATNLETTESVWVGAKIEEEGGICVSSKLLTEFVSSLPQGTLELLTHEGNLTINGSRVTATIPGIAASEFPPIPKIKEKTETSLPKKDFIEALRMVLFTAATDEGRPILTGIKIKQTKDQTLFAATDGYRLSVKKIKLALTPDANIIVPARALSEVMKVSGEEKEGKEITLAQTDDGQLVFESDDSQLFTRLIDGEFPPFEKIIPASHSTHAVIDREQLTRAVKTASIFARDNANIIRMKVSEGTVEVSANTPQVGENKVEIDGKVEGEGGEIAFNSRFLSEFLANFTEDELVFEMTGSLNPGVFKLPDDDSYLHIIMPVRVQS